MGSKEMLFLKSSLCPQQRHKQEKSHSVKRQEVGEGGREAKERVEKKESLCCVAWLSTQLSLYRMIC